MPMAEWSSSPLPLPTDTYVTTGWSKKRHRVNDTIILQPYVRVMWFSAKCSERIFYVTKISIRIQQLLPLAVKLCKKNSRPITLDTAVHKNMPLLFFNSSVKHWPILIIFGTRKKLDANVCSFGHLALRLSLHYLVKCRSRSLTIDNNEFILGTACVSSENYWDHKIIENLLLHLYFKVVSRQTERLKWYINSESAAWVMQ